MARLRGAGDGPTLCLLSHVDTVLADPAEWQRDPWSGDVVDGELWGRGAQDMKSQTAAEVTAALALAQSGWRPAHGDLLVVCVVDEETGGGEGAMWLTENHPDAVRCDLLLNEGAGAVFPFGDERVYGVCVAEKGVFRFTVTTEGVAGHASTPKMGDNALLKMVPFLQAMGERQPPYDVTETPRALLAELGLPLDGDPAPVLDALRERDPILAVLVEPMLGVTLAPTRIFASEKINVIPSRARLAVDCRTPPGMEEAEVRARIVDVLGPNGYELEFTEKVVGNSLAARHAAHGRAARLGRARGSRGARGPDHAAGLHRLAHLPRRLPGVRGLRLLPPARDEPLRDLAARALARRADRDGRPRVRRALLSRRDQGAAR